VEWRWGHISLIYATCLEFSGETDNNHKTPVLRRLRLGRTAQKAPKVQHLCPVSILSSLQEPRRYTAYRAVTTHRPQYTAWHRALFVSCTGVTSASRLRTQPDVICCVYIIYNIYIYIFNCNWVATRWQYFSTHIHTNSTGNVTKQTSHRTTQKNT
jgi:hypothetical protein